MKLNSILLISALVLNSCSIQTADRQYPAKIRFATFNAAMGLAEEGELQRRLVAGDDPALIKLAAILQRVRPDVVLLNEFDFEPDFDSAASLKSNYLIKSQYGELPINYPHSFSAPVNTGVDSGLDLDQDGQLGGPGDGWGFGKFPGQYGMLVLSRYPIDQDTVRTFRTMRWTAMPNANLPVDPEHGGPWYPAPVAAALRLSSKSHWDIPILVAGQEVHFLTLHPTPPVFDGPEDRNGRRNFDEIRLIHDYIDPQRSAYIVDDKGAAGGLLQAAQFIIAGDLNSDPSDGDSDPGAIAQLLEHPLINASCQPGSNGAKLASVSQGGVNLLQQGNPALDTADFNDQFVGNLRLDYVLPSANLNIKDCGVFWPAPGDRGAEWIQVSDHRLSWIDLPLSAD